MLSFILIFHSLGLLNVTFNGLVFVFRNLSHDLSNAVNKPEEELNDEIEDEQLANEVDKG